MNAASWLLVTIILYLVIRRRLGVYAELATTPNASPEPDKLDE